MGRLRIFAKGNVDVRDALLYSAVGGRVEWNGLNEVFRARGLPLTARVRHEPWSRSDALLASPGLPPADLLARKLPLGTFTPEVQFSRRLFDTPADAVVLSLQPDLFVPLARHRTAGYLFHPHDWRRWPAADQQWLHAAFEWVGYLDVDASARALTEVCRLVRAFQDVPILLFNVSSVVPGEQVFCHQGLDEALSTRIRRFNLLAVELSSQLGLFLVDVDRIVAAAGAHKLKVDAVHLTAEGWRSLAEETADILLQLGVGNSTAEETGDAR